MKDNQMVIRCLNCGTKNRIPNERLHDRPLCGKCGATMDEMIIRCLECGTKNRMPENRLTDQPLCGKCGATLVATGDQGRPFDVTDGTFSREVLSSPDRSSSTAGRPGAVPAARSRRSSMSWRPSTRAGSGSPSSTSMKTPRRRRATISAASRRCSFSRTATWSTASWAPCRRRPSNNTSWPS